MNQNRRCIVSLYLSVAAFTAGAQTIPKYTHVIIDSTTQSDALDKVFADFNGDGVPDAVLGYGTFTGPGGLFLYQAPSNGDATQHWSKSAIAAHGNFYEAAVAFDVDGDGLLDIVASTGNQLGWFKNPGAANITQQWTETIINGSVGAHALKIADIDGDGKPDIVSPGGAFAGGAGFIAFQNGPNSWTNVSVARTGFDVALLDTGSGMGRINLVTCESGRTTWFENPREHGQDARTAHWDQWDIGPGDSGNSIATGQIAGKQVVFTASNENQWPYGFVYFSPNSTDARHGGWHMNTINDTYRLLHQINVQDMNGDAIPDLVVSEQEQTSSKRVSVFYGDGLGGFVEQILATTGGNNQVVASFNGKPAILSSNHGIYDNYNPLEMWAQNPGSSSGGGGGLSAGTYAITDGASNWAMDAGFYYWSGITNMEEWQQTSANQYQQWSFQASGSDFTICNVGIAACLTDNGDTLQIGQGMDTWRVTASGNGYTIRNARTGNYLNDPDAQRGVVHTSAAPTVWSIHTPL